MHQQSAHHGLFERIVALFRKEEPPAAPVQGIALRGEQFPEWPTVPWQPGALFQAARAAHPEWQPRVQPSAPWCQRANPVLPPDLARFSAAEVAYRHTHANEPTLPRSVDELEILLNPTPRPAWVDALCEQPSGPISRADLLAVTEEECRPDLEKDDEEETVARQNPALYRLRLIARAQEESE